MSIDIFGYDKTIVLHSDTVSLFQSFHKLKSDVSEIINTLKIKQEEDNEEIQRIKRDEVDRASATLRSEKIHEILTEISYEPPYFLKQLQDATIQEGDKFTFDCFVKGSPEPKVEWFKDGIAIQNNSDYQTTYKNGLCTLSIEETFTADSACFTCRAFNSVGTTETQATLTVREVAGEELLTPPIFTKFLESGRAKEGTSFEFNCIVTGNPLPNVQWFKNDTCVDSSPDYIISYNNGEAVLRFEEVFLEDQAIFTCKAINPIGSEQSSASLSVERKSTISFNNSIFVVVGCLQPFFLI